MSTVRLKPMASRHADLPKGSVLAALFVVNIIIAFMAGIYFGASRAGSWTTWWMFATFGLVVTAVICTWWVSSIAAYRVGLADGQRAGIEVGRMESRR